MNQLIYLAIAWGIIGTLLAISADERKYLIYTSIPSLFIGCFSLAVNLLKEAL